MRGGEGVSIKLVVGTCLLTFAKDATAVDLAARDLGLVQAREPARVAAVRVTAVLGSSRVVFLVCRSWVQPGDVVILMVILACCSPC